MKKGYVCQKDNLIKNLPNLYYKNYPKNTSFIFSIIISIMDDIELYEKSSQKLFSESLGKLGEKFSERKKEDHLNELNKIINHFLIAISTLEKSISDEYVIHFNDLINKFCENNFKIIINKELIEYTISLGKFGQSCVNKKFSVFFCVCLIRISKNKIEDLYNRVLFLAEDTERKVKFEMTYHMRFIIKLNDSKFCEEKMINFLNYYLEDVDMKFLFITFESLFYSDNLSKFENCFSFMKNFYNKINEITTCNDFYTLSYDFHNISDIFLCLLNYCYNIGNNNKELIKYIKIYLKNFFNENELKISTNVIVSFKNDYCLKNFDKICCIFYKEKDIQFLKEIIPIAIDYYFQMKENLDIFYENLHLILLYLPNDFLTKPFFNKMLFFIEDDNNGNSQTNNNPLILSDLNSPSNKDSNINLNNQNNYLNFKKDYKEYWLNNFNLIMERMIEIGCDKFIKCLLSKLNNFLNLIKKGKEWRITIKLFKGIQLLPKYIMLNYKKYSNYEDYLQILYNFCKDLLKKEINILIEKEIMQLLSEIIHFSIFRKEILEYLKNNFLLNKSFYRRRIYCLFGDCAYNVFSKEFISQFNIYSNLFDNILINDIPLMQSYILQILIKYELYEQNLINKVKSILNNSKTKNDILVIVIIKKYLNLSSSNVKNKKANNNENEKINLEKKVKDIEKGFNIKDKKEDSFYKKTIKPKVKTNINKKNNNKKASNIFQKIDDNKNQLYLRKSSMNNNNQEKKINEYFSINGGNSKISNSTTNVPKIKKTKNNNNNNNIHLNKSMNNISKNSNK